MKRSQFRGLTVLVLSIGCGLLNGCLVVDHDDDDVEYVKWINHTPYEIDNYIDDEFIGRIGAYDELQIHDRHLDGRRNFYSRGVYEQITWGPDEFYIDDGERFVLDLYDDGRYYMTRDTDDRNLILP